MSAAILETNADSFAGFKPLREGRIHLLCGQCGRKMSNMRRADYDPPRAALIAVPCERCSQGCKIEGGEYYDAAGKPISFEETSEDWE